MGDWKKKTKDLYVKIDAKKYEKTGQIEVISGPMEKYEIFEFTGKAPKGSFEICYPETLMKFITCITKKKSAVLNYLIENKDEENKLLANAAFLSKKTGCCHKTCYNTLVDLEEYGLIVRSGNTIMLNPYLMHRGSTFRSRVLFQKYLELDAISKKFSSNSEKNIDKEEDK